MVQQIEGAPHRGGATDAFVLHDRLGDLLADRIDGIERCHRLLEDHRDRTAAQLRQLRRRQLEHRLAVQPDVALDLRVIGQQAHQRLQADTLAGAGFAKDGQRLAACQRERHAVHRRHIRAAATEAHRQIVDPQDRRFNGHDVRHAAPAVHAADGRRRDARRCHRRHPPARRAAARVPRKSPVRRRSGCGNGSRKAD